MGRSEGPQGANAPRKLVAFLRGINVGGHNKLPMAMLREICVSLGLQNPQTYIQSGNIVFASSRHDLPQLALDLEQAIQDRCAFRPPVILRTAAELEAILAANPFQGLPGLNPAALLITFYPTDPGEAARARLMSLDHAGEHVHALGRETYIRFQNGMGKTKLKFNVLDKAMGVPGTGRNLNTVQKLLELTSAL